MVFTPLLTESKFEHLKLPTQIDVFEDSSVNHALTHVAQTIMRTLQHTYSIQDNSSNHTQTISIRAIEPEHRQIMFIEPLSSRELQVLQLIVDGDRNSIIAQKLYIAEGTVKAHVHNIFKKLCVSDRTQAAIRALRSGLVH
jgi:DNA-binding NarL/FixJ family response regulator